MLIFWEVLVITKQYFQNIPKIFHKFLFQKYSKDITGILQGYGNVFMESKSSKYCFVGYPVKILILVASALEMIFSTFLKPFSIKSKELRVMF